MKAAAPQKAIGLTERLADLLRSEDIGLTTVIAIADALSAGARFNMWFLDNAKSRAAESEVLAKIDEYGCLTDMCIAAIEKFEADTPAKVSKDASLKNLKELEAALRAFSKAITEAMVIAS
ncbi:MAG TPA: hypothetical protein VFI23_04710 [Rhizomicrobium sp.]|nr:hypothetical protein [Rhizomicrobium sp.]